MSNSITPEKYERIKNQFEEALSEREASIKRMREQDPNYWTPARLAKHWKTTRQNMFKLLRKIEK